MERHHIEVFNQFCRRFFTRCRTQKAAGLTIPTKETYFYSKEDFGNELRDYYNQEAMPGILQELQDAGKLKVTAARIYFHPDLPEVAYMGDNY